MLGGSDMGRDHGARRSHCRVHGRRESALSSTTPSRYGTDTTFSFFVPTAALHRSRCSTMASLQGKKDMRRADLSMCLRRPPMPHPQPSSSRPWPLALAPIRNHASGSLQITCTDMSQSCPTQSRPTARQMRTCRVGDGLSAHPQLHSADAVFKAQWQAPCPWLL